MRGHWRIGILGEHLYQEHRVMLVTIWILTFKILPNPHTKFMCLSVPDM